MKSNELIDYLNSIEAKVKTKHQEFKIEQYNLSVVLFTLNSTTNKGINIEYKVNIIANKDNANVSWRNIRNKTFINEEEANKYYNNLIKFLAESDVEDIKYVLQDE